MTRYDYDPAGNQIKMTDANGGIYQTTYDEPNRKSNFSYPPDAIGQNRWESWRYDIAGNLLWYKNPAGQFKHFEYDERNRQKESYWNTSELGTNRDQSIGDRVITEFDDASRVTWIGTSGLSATTSVAYGYDEANHKIWEDQALNYGATRRVETPDDDGNRRTLTIAGVYALTYDYTPRQQLFHINAIGAGQFFEYTYDKNGNLKKRQNVWQGGGSTNFSYDIGNRVTMCTQFKSSSDPDAFSRGDYNDYDLVNNLKSISREEDQWKGERFEYDDANQLRSASYRVEVGPHDAPQGAPVGQTELAEVAEVSKDAAQEAVAVQEPDPVREPLAGGDAPSAPAGPRTVTYLNDAITRKSMNNNGAVTTYTPNGLNQYTAVTGHNTPVYDANFNLKGYDGWTYLYDADKRLISVSGNGHNAQFVYDGLGRCVRRTIDGDATTFTFDEWKPIVEWNSSGTHVAWNLYGPGADEILIRYQYNTGGYVHYHLDAMGNVQFLMSADNLGLEKYTYDAFGKPTITTWDGVPLAVSQVGNRFMFTGREYLYTFGIYDYRHRHYHPGLGRFIQTDPVGFGGDPMNLYRYCGNNPVGRGDPMGLDWAAEPDQTPINFDKIDAVPPQSKGANGYTARTTFSAIATADPADGGYALRYHDVKIRSTSYIRTHQRHFVNGNVWGPKREDRLTKADIERTTGHENRQKAIDHRIYDDWHNNGTFKGMIEDGKTYRSPGEANNALKRNEGTAKEAFEGARQKEGTILQQQDGMQYNHFETSGPTAKDVDARHQATGVPSLGAESVNRLNGVL